IHVSSMRMRNIYLEESRFKNKKISHLDSSKLDLTRDLDVFSDRGGIRTPNPQSRNLIFYPVELRSHYIPVKAGIFFRPKASLQLLKWFCRRLVLPIACSQYPLLSPCLSCLLHQFGQLLVIL